jgi:hypothetical protein
VVLARDDSAFSRRLKSNMTGLLSASIKVLFN